ncbi:hypothetical protein [Rubritalea tangerina]|uniref:DUF4388 domain-containing protein n=1 Tax=Rubritalea tangerina TaxID=430798 RepID=A0ABW4ZC85_9BACT
MNEKPEDNKALDLSALDFGPSWARQGESKPSKKYTDHPGERGGQRRDGNKGKRREGGRPQRGERGKFSRDHRGRDERRRPQRPQPVAAPEGLVADIMPIEEGIDNLSKEIVAAGRTYSVFELARMILASRERYKIVFRKEEGGPELLQCKYDGAVYLSKGECLSHFRTAEWIKELYVSEEVEVEAPKGSFQTIAKCGFSGEVFGPPNYHAYNQKIVDLHQAQFSNMSLDRYKSRIVTESGEDAVNAWLDTMKKQVQYRPVADTETVLASEKEMLSHFEANAFGETFRATHRADVDSQIPGKLLSPGLLTLLKETISEQRRYPGKLAPFLCRQLSGRHLAVFKWQGKLHCGPSRPHAIADDVKLAERPEALYKWVNEHPGAGVDELWKGLLSEDVTDEVKKEWFHDLHWMINQGYIVLLSDGHIFTSNFSKPKAAKKQGKSQKPVSQEVSPEPVAEVVTEEAQATPEANEDQAAAEVKEPTEAPSSEEAPASEEGSEEPKA